MSYNPAAAVIFGVVAFTLSAYMGFFTPAGNLMAILVLHDGRLGETARMREYVAETCEELEKRGLLHLHEKEEAPKTEVKK